MNNPHYGDNIRVYVPLDLNEDTIISRLQYLINVLGVPNYNNESTYSTEVDRLIQQLDIYNRVWGPRDTSHSEKNCTVSQQGKRLARHMVEELLELDEEGGGAECFSYFFTIDSNFAQSDWGREYSLYYWRIT